VGSAEYVMSADLYKMALYRFNARLAAREKRMD